MSWWKKTPQRGQAGADVQQSAERQADAVQPAAAQPAADGLVPANTLRKGDDKPFVSPLLAVQDGDARTGSSAPAGRQVVTPVHQQLRPQRTRSGTDVLHRQAVTQAARTGHVTQPVHSVLAVPPVQSGTAEQGASVLPGANAESSVVNTVSPAAPGQEPTGQNNTLQVLTPEEEQEAHQEARREKARADAAGGIDWWLFVILVMILGIGLVMVLSASGIVAENDYGDKYYFFKKQLTFALAGGVLMGIAAMVPRSLLYKSHYPLLFMVLFLLLLTLSPLSPSINGAHRWIRVGPVSVQPMEFVKIALALYLAYYMATKQELVKTFSRGVVPPFLVTLLFCGLLLMQPDFGSSVVLALLLLLMCIAGGTRLFYIIMALIMAIVGVVALVIFEPYRMRRLMAFLDPFKDAHDTGYQLVQSLLAIGSGSFFGVGMGASRQKMFYLPEAHNDFIMAVLAEEMGFVGVSVVMLLFLFFFWRCYLIIRGQEELRARYAAFALSCIIALGVILNLAVVMGVAPPKGVPMPFLSYGGSNLVAMMICAGLLLNFSRTAKLPH